MRVEEFVKEISSRIQDFEEYYTQEVDPTGSDDMSVEEWIELFSEYIEEQ